MPTFQRTRGLVTRPTFRQCLSEGKRTMIAINQVSVEHRAISTTQVQQNLLLMISNRRKEIIRNRNLTGAFHVGLVSNYQSNHLLWIGGKLIHVQQPTRHRVKRILVCDVVNYNHAGCSPEIVCCNRPESLLPSSIPYLQLHHFAIQFDGAYFEVHPNGGDIDVGKAIIREPA